MSEVKVKMLISRAGPGVSDLAGDVISVGEAEAMRMVKAGQAELVAKKPEKAVKKTTTAKRAK